MLVSGSVSFFGVYFFPPTPVGTVSPPHPSDQPPCTAARAVQFLLSRSASIVHRDHEVSTEGEFVADPKWAVIHYLGMQMSWVLHPGRLTWNLQITHLERKMIFQTSIIVFHVNLPGCTLLGDANFLGVTVL